MVPYIYPCFYVNGVRPPLPRRKSGMGISDLYFRKSDCGKSKQARVKIKNDIEIGDPLRCIFERRPELLSNPLRIVQMINPRSRPCVFPNIPLANYPKGPPPPLVTLFRRRAPVIRYISRIYFRDG